jgi:hypothetical protein
MMTVSFIARKPSYQVLSMYRLNLPHDLPHDLPAICLTFCLGSLDSRDNAQRLSAANGDFSSMDSLRLTRQPNSPTTGRGASIWHVWPHSLTPGNNSFGPAHPPLSQGKIASRGSNLGFVVLDLTVIDECIPHVPPSLLSASLS